MARPADPAPAGLVPSGLAPPGLVLVATPIGNLSDLSPRASACLAQADLVLCEDTRNTGHLLSAWGITARLEAMHEHNERQRLHRILGLLREGRTIALVSDAGTPLLSDPGFPLVRAAIAEGLPVSAIPGPNAAVMALTLSGLPPHPFLFVGFPPTRESARRSAFGALRAAEQAGLRATLIWHEAPHRLAEMLADLAAVFGEARQAAVARELTKRFEEVVRGTAGELARRFTTHAARGEITVLLAPMPDEQTGADELDQRLREALADHSVKDAASLVAAATDLPRRLVYSRAMMLAHEVKAEGQRPDSE